MALSTETGSDIAAGRLDAETLKTNFADLHPPLDRTRRLSRPSAATSATTRRAARRARPRSTSRCSSARSPPTIRSARRRRFSTPTSSAACAPASARPKTLCEEACVREHAEGKPVEDRPAAALRHRRARWRPASSPSTRGAVDRQARRRRRRRPGGPRLRAPRWRCWATTVVIFEARPKPGGLNEYGIAAYKTTDDFAAREVDVHPRSAASRCRPASRSGATSRWTTLRNDYDAVFLGLGLPASTSSGSPARTRSKTSTTPSTSSPRCARPAICAQLPVGRRVVVIGGGMTAIDAAVQSKRLGAERGDDRLPPRPRAT